MAEELRGRIRACLEDLRPLHFALQDDSAAHAGHAGAKAGGHFRLELVSAAFEGLTRVQRHRLIYDRLGPLMQGRIHALTMRLLAPSESDSAAVSRPAAEPGAPERDAASS